MRVYFLILFFVTNTIFSQERFSFDYYSEYEFQKKENEEANLKVTVFSNSKDNSYFLSVQEKKGSIVRAYFINRKTKITTTLGLNKFYENLKNNTIEIINIDKINAANFGERDMKYSMFTKQDSVNEYIIVGVKNSKKKNTKNDIEYHIEFEKSEKYKNQIINHPDLHIPLLYEKFNFDLPGIAKKTYFVSKNKIEKITTLTKLDKIDFSFLYKLKSH
jgi:hypothetical protein